MAGSTDAVSPAVAGRPARFDVHVHLAGTGTQGSGCWTSPAFRRRPTFVGLRLLFVIRAKQMRSSVDQDWAALVSQLVTDSQIDYAVALGFDGVYDEAGRLRLDRSQMIVPSSWVFEVCGRWRNLLPGPSIHPYRRDALERLEEAIELGATLIKWLPIVQGIDPSSARAAPFLRRMADAGVPLLVHAGSGEVTFRTDSPDLGRVRSLRPALEMGVKVICAHGAAPVLYSRAPSEIPDLLELLREFENLWVDNSGLANPSRFPYLPRFADDPRIAERTLHGSDFPVIAGAFYYPRRLGISVIQAIHQEGNGIEREVLIKRAVGFDEKSFTRAGGVLANLDRWC